MSVEISHATAPEPAPGPLPLQVIDAEEHSKLLDIADLRQYKDLLFFLVWRDIKTLYAQTVLGFGWAIIRPVFYMLVFTIVFGVLAGVSTDGIPGPLFYYSAQLPWIYFSSAVSAATSSMIAGGNLLSKVYFPRIFMPITPVLTELVNTGIAFIIMLGLMVWYRVNPGWQVLALPLPILLMVLTTAGAGFWLSALAVQYRDVKHGIAFVITLLMYVGPVVWPASTIVAKFADSGHAELGYWVRLIYGLYPMVGVIEGFRACLVGSAANPPMPVPWDLLGIGFASATLMALTGLYYFKWRERVFADVA